MVLPTVKELKSWKLFMLSPWIELRRYLMFMACVEYSRILIGCNNS